MAAHILWWEIRHKDRQEVCVNCGFPINQGEHNVWLDSKEFGCRVPVLCNNPKPLGVITGD